MCLCETSLLMHDWGLAAPGSLPSEKISHVIEGIQIKSFCCEKQNFVAKQFTVQNAFVVWLKTAILLSLFISFMYQQSSLMLHALKIFPQCRKDMFFCLWQYRIRTMTKMKWKKSWGALESNQRGRRWRQSSILLFREGRDIFNNWGQHWDAPFSILDSRFLQGHHIPSWGIMYPRNMRTCNMGKQQEIWGMSFCTVLGSLWYVLGTGLRDYLRVNNKKWNKNCKKWSVIVSIEYCC